MENLEHAQWATLIVPVPKGNGQFGDYKCTINDALEIDQHPLGRPNDLFTTLTRGEYIVTYNDQINTINTHQGLLLP